MLCNTKKQEDDCNQRCEYMSHWSSTGKLIIVSLAWLKQRVKDSKIKNLKNLLGDLIDLQAVVGKRILYAGYTPLAFIMGNAMLNSTKLQRSQNSLCRSVCCKPYI